jgi:hypothetical protein
VEERTLVWSVPWPAGWLAQAVLAAHGLIREQSNRSWAERIVPFHLSPVVTPRNWSFEESTRRMLLDGPEAE